MSPSQFAYSFSTDGLAARIDQLRLSLPTSQEMNMYLDTSNQFDVSTAEEVDVATGSGPSVPSFSGLEWSVVALARRDRIASLRAPGRIATAMRGLFGTSRPARLADGRLEALRRIAVLAWHHGYAIPVSELRAFLAAGFSSEQYEMLQTSIGHGRVSARSRMA